jgi:hypothetical protein
VQSQNKIDALKTKELAAGGKFRMEEIPLRKFYDQAQYIEVTLLPAIERKSGKTSADYQFFAGVYRSLLYACMIVDRGSIVMQQCQKYKQLNDFYRGRAELAERELLKYQTVEDLYMTDAMDRVAAGVKKRVEDLLTNK